MYFLLRWTKILGLALISVFLFSCNGDDPAPDATPRITSIFPVAGEAGTTVKVRGKNLNGNNPVVYFNGVVAQLVTASDSVLEVKSPRGSSTGPVTVQANNKTLTGPEYKFYHLYCYGKNNNAAVYWKDGDLIKVQDKAYITEMVVNGNETYAIGGSSEAGYIAAYWKNNVLTAVEEVDSQTIFTGIAVAGSDVHICGIVSAPSPTGWIAKYWKNGELIMESPAREGGTQFLDIAADGNDVYIAGINYPSAALWKNGALTNFTTERTFSLVRKIRIAGSDIYLIGADANPFGIVVEARHWKNNNPVALTNHSGFSPRDFLVRSNGSALMVGNGFQGEEYGQRFAKEYFQGQVKQLSDELYHYGSAIEATESATYVLTNSDDTYGNYFAPSYKPIPYGGILKKNGTNITPSYSEGFFGGVFGFLLEQY